MKKIFFLLVVLLCGCAPLQNLGRKITIDRTVVNPPSVAPGAAVTSEVEYTLNPLWLPRGGAIVESRFIQCDGEAIKLSQKSINGVPGKSVSRFKFMMPSDVSVKQCNLTTILAVENESMTATDTISIKR